MITMNESGQIYTATQVDEVLVEHNPNTYHLGTLTYF
jgi:hypothetical protein